MEQVHLGSFWKYFYWVNELVRWTYKVYHGAGANIIILPQESVANVASHLELRKVYN